MTGIREERETGQCDHLYGDRRDLYVFPAELNGSEDDGEERTAVLKS